MNYHYRSADVIRSGDIEGRLTLYDAAGELLLKPEESLIRVAEGWDMNVRSPWRRILPNVIFAGFSKKVSSRLYVTTLRIVLIRDIDPWREVKGDMTPLGMPAALAKAASLKELEVAGIRQFCEVHPESLRAARIRTARTQGAWIGLHLVGADGRQYAVSYWKVEGKDVKTLSLLESRFPR